MQVRLKGSQPVTLADVEKDDEQGIIGTTTTGKRFVARRDRLAKPIPPRHPFRVYLTSGELLRVVDPAFEDVEAFYLGAPGEDALGTASIELTLEHGEDRQIQHAEVLSLLSALPEDERAAQAQANGHVADEDEGDAGEAEEQEGAPTEA